MLGNELMKHGDALFTKLLCRRELIGIEHYRVVELHLCCWIRLIETTNIRNVHLGNAPRSTFHQSKHITHTVREGEDAHNFCPVDPERCGQCPSQF